MSTITLFHHPYSRAANTIWMLEEVGVPYKLKFVDILKGDSKLPEIVNRNAMGKIPMIEDGTTIVTESAAIGLYVADRYAYGRLSPKVDDAARGTYLRWSFFAPSVIEPGIMAKTEGWKVNQNRAGWGSYTAIIDTLDKAIAKGPYLLGDTFYMVDVIVGGMLAWLLANKDIEAKETFVSYVKRLKDRPAYNRSTEINNKVCTENGLKVY